MILNDIYRLPNIIVCKVPPLFRASLEAILDPEHELIRLAALIDWERFDDAFGRYYREARAGAGCRPGSWSGCIC
jgi:IS5 family transposase